MDAILKGQAEELANELAAQVATLEDLDGLMRTMMRTALDRMLNTEMAVHLQWRGATEPAPAPRDPTDTATTATKNRRNGHSKKTVGRDRGEFALKTPRDRNGTLDPQLIAKGPRRPDGFDEAVPALYAKGMATRDLPCIAHLARAAFKSATETDGRDVATDLKAIDQSAPALEAEEA